MRLRLLGPVAVLALAACARLPATGGEVRGAGEVPAAPAGSGERLITVEGRAGRLRVSDGGSGEPAVVLVHGLGSELEVWREQLDHLRASRRAVAYDQRGHGRSDRARDGAYTVDALAADLDAVIAALGLGRVVLIGHGAGGPVITAYGGAHPEKVAGLAYVEAVGDYSVVPRPIVEAMLEEEASPSFSAARQRKAFEELLDGYAKPATREKVLASLERFDPRAFAALRRSMTELDAPGRLGPYAGPMTAIEAAMSRSPIRASEVLGLRRKAIRDVSPWLMLDDPAALDRALDAFLASLSPPASPRG
jgi:pimeloyl-ACP methyl ester carboxylesterase